MHEHEDEKVEARNVTMYPGDWADVERLAITSGVQSLSGALRIIVREWRAFKRQERITRLQQKT